MTAKEEQEPEIGTEEEDLEALQDKIEQSQKEHAPKNPCPYCNQELPEDYVIDDKKAVTLSLKDANTLAAAAAKQELKAAQMEHAREDLNEFLQDTGDKYNYYNPQVGIDWDKEILTGVDANNKLKETEIKVTKEEIKRSQKLFYEVMKTASKARRAQNEKRELIVNLAIKYKFNQFPCDIRNNKFVGVTDEVLRQQNLRLDQLEQQLKQPRLSDEEDKSCNCS